MEPFENDNIPRETPDPSPAVPVSEERTVPQDPGAYHGTGTGRKESPYENSPYVRQFSQPEYSYQPQYSSTDIRDDR